MSERQPPPGDAADADAVAAGAVLGAHRAAAELGASVVEAGAGGATVRLEVAPHLVNGHGVCHGGVLFALADLAATAAAAAPGRVVTSTGATIELVSPAPLGSVLVARSVEVHARGRSAVYDTSIAVPDTGGGTEGAVVALVRSRLRLADGP